MRSAHSKQPKWILQSCSAACSLVRLQRTWYVLLRLRLPTWFSLTSGVTGTTVTVLLGTVVLLVSARLVLQHIHIPQLEMCLLPKSSLKRQNSATSSYVRWTLEFVLHTVHNSSTTGISSVLHTTVLSTVNKHTSRFSPLSMISTH